MQALQKNSNSSPSCLEAAAFGSPGTVYLWQKNQPESASSATLAIRNHFVETTNNANSVYSFNGTIPFNLVAENSGLNFK